MSYLLVCNTAITQSALVEHITPYRQVVRDYVHQLNIVTLSTGSPGKTRASSA